jgi:asparagine synthase (glutamine-hydrolysing)
MCGIVCVFGKRAQFVTGTLKHRGPDATKVMTMGKCTMEFFRLAINDLSESGMQPFTSDKGMLVCNGEIYNHEDLYIGTGSSDCECLLPLIQLKGIMELVKDIRGVFAFCYTDGESVLAARDHLGIRPMFYARFTGDDGEPAIAFASEVKALLQFEAPVHIFPPGHVFDSHLDDFVPWYTGYYSSLDDASRPNAAAIRDELTEAVEMRVRNTDRPVGFLLSGGLDSSLVVAIAKKFIERPRTFSIATSPDSPDAKAARKVAEHLGTDHTEIIFTIDEGLEVLHDVIRSLESYDTTTVRASVPMWLLARWISKNTDCKVILSGEGSDELFGGYLYFHGAPSLHAFSSECSRRLKLIHQFDGLRADRCMAAHGLELRVPFLDKAFVDYVTDMDQSLKRTDVEKRVLREAFDDGVTLPKEILWRQKNGMSDAVGYDWVDEVKKFCEKHISDESFEEARRASRGHNVPKTKEEAVYRSFFWSMFTEKNDHLISEIWRPKWTSVTDPSARQLGFFQESD